MEERPPFRQGEKRKKKGPVYGACSVESEHEPHSSAAGPALPDRLLDRRAGREPPELRLERLVFGNDHLNTSISSGGFELRLERPLGEPNPRDRVAAEKRPHPEPVDEARSGAMCHIPPHTRVPLHLSRPLHLRRVGGLRGRLLLRVKERSCACHSTGSVINWCHTNRVQETSCTSAPHAAPAERGTSVSRAAAQRSCKPG